uniref:Uncharacterized protein n=1 Tax=Arundo donax TaxID=35708 RepID=A0A0A9AZH6_ARUDO
MCKTCIEPLNV